MLYVSNLCKHSLYSVERNLRRLHCIQVDTGLHSSVANMHHFDPDPARHFHADPDLSFQIIRIRNIAAPHIASFHR